MYSSNHNFCKTCNFCLFTKDFFALWVQGGGGGEILARQMGFTKNFTLVIDSIMDYVFKWMPSIRFEIFGGGFYPMGGLRQGPIKLIKCNFGKTGVCQYFDLISKPGLLEPYN